MQVTCSLIECWLIPLINTLIYTLSILNQHSIDSSVDNWLTCHQYLSQQTVKSRLIFDWCSWVGQHLVNYCATVDRMSIMMLIELLIECQLRCHSQVNQGTNHQWTMDAFPVNLWLDYSGYCKNSMSL